MGGFSGHGLMDFELEIVQGDSSVGIDGSLDSKTENILDRLIRREDGVLFKGDLSF